MKLAAERLISCTGSEVGCLSRRQTRCWRRRELVLADSRPPSDMAPSASSTISMQIFNAIRLGALHLAPMCCLSYREACEYCMQRCTTQASSTKLEHISSDVVQRRWWQCRRSPTSAFKNGNSKHYSLHFIRALLVTIFR